MNDRTIVETSLSEIINTPAAQVDLADWLFGLPTAEYQRCCPPAHIAAGTTTSDDGRPMSINVEMIGDSLLIENYVGEIVSPHHLHMVSTSDVFSPLGRTTNDVIWDLSVRPRDEQTCEFVNYVKGVATTEFLEFLERHQTAFDQARAALCEATAAHNRQETPLFAQSIERRARSAR